MKITLCGSMAFYTELEAIAEQLRKHHEVEVPLLRMESDRPDKDRKMSIRAVIEQFGGVDAVPLGHPIWQEKANAIDDHFAKVAWSDAILVVNYAKRGVEGYIGGNTLMEMGVARFLNKKIYLLMPVSAELSYKEEILGMQPTVINDDLSLIS